MLATFIFDGRWRVIEDFFVEIARSFFFENEKYFLLMTRTVAHRRRNHSCRLSLFESLS
jgi:hypothetical protein